MTNVTHEWEKTVLRNSENVTVFGEPEFAQECLDELRLVVKCLLDEIEGSYTP